MKIYMVRFLTKDGAESFLVKLDDQEQYDNMKEILTVLEDAGDIRDADLILVNENMAITPDQWQYEMEKKFGGIRKGRPDVSRVDERLDPETETVVRDLLVAAFEGGSNYWYRIESEKLPPGTTKADFKKGGRMQPPEDYFHPMELIPTYPGGHLVIRDVGEGEGETHVLDLGALKRGLILLKEKYPKVFKRAMEGDYDADDGDTFLQLALFGEVILG